jgi:hypothetical protein
LIETEAQTELGSWEARLHCVSFASPSSSTVVNRFDFIDVSELLSSERAGHHAGHLEQGDLVAEVGQIHFPHLVEFVRLPYIESLARIASGRRYRLNFLFSDIARLATFTCGVD